jgi:hypothetical protein
MQTTGESKGFSAIADELYALSFDDFTKERNDRAKDVGGDQAKLIRALPKPSAAAWAVNMLARHHADELEQLLAIGDALRDAQDNLDRAALSTLGKQRRALIAAMASQAGTLAADLGHPVSASVVTEIGQTLQAGLTDADAAAAVASGRLVRSLTAEGESVDVADAVAGSDSLRSPARKPPAPVDLAAKRAAKERAAAERAVRDAEHALEQAEAAQAKAEKRVRDLRDRRGDIVDELEEARMRVAELEDSLDQADGGIRSAETDADTAKSQAKSAKKAAVAANGQLTKLR